MKPRILLSSFIALVCTFNLSTNAVRAQSDSLVTQVLSFQTSGVVNLGSGLAQLHIPSGFKYLDADQSNYVLSGLWGNPPAPTWGLLFPEYANDTFPNTWAISIGYSDEGHIDDEDAKEIDYDELLESMKEAAKESAEERRNAGYTAYEIVGWAAPPFYDEGAKKLHWAKKLKFEGDSVYTLNYHIRVLGKEGVLELNVIGSPDDLPEIRQNLGGLLGAFEFQSGNRYADFKEGVDKKATYGIAGLIAGGVLMKTGLLAKIGIFLLKFSKVIIMGLIAGAGAIYQWFRKKVGRKDGGASNEDATQTEA